MWQWKVPFCASEFGFQGHDLIYAASNFIFQSLLDEPTANPPLEMAERHAIWSVLP